MAKPGRGRPMKEEVLLLPVISKDRSREAASPVPGVAMVEVGSSSSPPTTEASPVTESGDNHLMEEDGVERNENNTWDAQKQWHTKPVQTEVVANVLEYTKNAAGVTVAGTYAITDFDSTPTEAKSAATMKQ
ncbi:hypothetical protein K7X08_000066 [Anisodus acutangulus]|uniref:Uncharacterized protein n=1 Tax=Anisodus acutangulus TaxID=402998 RepID=A0A9Q1M601_9SOLA|nr:hypothetical protein K7X08_000066 [Anisodus acutangulus]